MKIKVEEKTLELAIVKAARKLGLTQDELGYKVLEKSSGFLGLFGKKVSIEAWRRPSRGTNQSRTQRPQGRHKTQKQTTVSKRSDKLLKDEVLKFTKTLCYKMFNRKVKINCSMEKDRILLDISDDELSRQIAKNTKIAESLEHIIRKLPRRIDQDSRLHIFVDAKGVRQKREADLCHMAKDLSNKVFQNKRPIVLNYKSSYDRKVIHMALDQDRRVYTKSIGVGQNRKLMILPTKEQRRESNARDYS